MAANKALGLITGTKEYIKQFFVYDASGRMTDVYEARANAANGDVSFHTQYQYDGTSTRVLKMLETDSTWNSTWDM